MLDGHRSFFFLFFFLHSPINTMTDVLDANRGLLFLATGLNQNVVGYLERTESGDLVPVQNGLSIETFLARTGWMGGSLPGLAKFRKAATGNPYVEGEEGILHYWFRTKLTAQEQAMYEGGIAVSAKIPSLIAAKVINNAVVEVKTLNTSVSTAFSELKERSPLHRRVVRYVKQKKGMSDGWHFLKASAKQVRSVWPDGIRPGVRDAERDAKAEEAVWQLCRSTLTKMTSSMPKCTPGPGKTEPYRTPRGVECARRPPGSNWMTTPFARRPRSGRHGRGRGMYYAWDPVEATQRQMDALEQRQDQVKAVSRSTQALREATQQNVRAMKNASLPNPRRVGVRSRSNDLGDVW